MTLVEILGRSIKQASVLHALPKTNATTFRPYISHTSLGCQATEDAAALAARELKRQLDAQAQKHAAEIDALKSSHADELRKQADEFKANLDQAYQQFSNENARLQASLQSSSSSSLREESIQPSVPDNATSTTTLRPSVNVAKVQAA